MEAGGGPGVACSARSPLSAHSVQASPIGGAKGLCANPLDQPSPWSSPSSTVYDSSAVRLLTTEKICRAKEARDHPRVSEGVEGRCKLSPRGWEGSVKAERGWRVMFQARVKASWRAMNPNPNPHLGQSK